MTTAEIQAHLAQGQRFFRTSGYKKIEVIEVGVPQNVGYTNRRVRRGVKVKDGEFERTYTTRDIIAVWTDNDDRRNKLKAERLQIANQIATELDLGGYGDTVTVEVVAPFTEETRHLKITFKGNAALELMRQFNINADLSYKVK